MFAQPKKQGGLQPQRQQKKSIQVKSQPRVIPLQKQVLASPQPQRQSVPMDDAQLREAQARAREIIVEAKDEALAIREKAEREARLLRQEISDKERSLDQKLSSIDARLKLLDDRDKELETKRANIEKLKEEIETLRNQFVKKLEHVAGLTRDQAKQQILENLETELAKDTAQMIQAAENKAKEESDDKAREILIDAMKHGATEYVPEYTVSIVKIADDEVKGRIIGKDGRNIRSFELITGVDVDLDDQPGQVRLSCFDPVRREIARITLEHLIKDGRIQPTRIEETVQR